MRVTTRPTHTGDFMGIPPTGDTVEFTGIHVYRIADGKIAEEWFNHDLLTLMRHSAPSHPAVELRFLKANGQAARFSTSIPPAPSRASLSAGSEHQAGDRFCV